MSLSLYEELQQDEELLDEKRKKKKKKKKKKKRKRTKKKNSSSYAMGGLRPLFGFGDGSDASDNIISGEGMVAGMDTGGGDGGGGGE